MILSYSILVVVLFTALVVVVFVVIYLFTYKAPKKPDTENILWHFNECFPLKRSESNPLVSPTPGSFWESEATFNPAAIIDDDGTIHILYRALGNDGVSRLGYCCSPDGTSITTRHAYPVFEADCIDVSRYICADAARFNPAVNTSGGGWIGCEDPRLTIIDDTVYMLYHAFAGWDSIRIALTSLSLEQCKRGDWNWKKSYYISPPGPPQKNWVLFPEKINGKFAILHDIWPRISILYVKSLAELAHSVVPIPKSWNRGAYDGMPSSWILHEPGTAGDRWVDPVQLDNTTWNDPHRWDTWTRGAGPSPIKTSEGWLLIYHAMQKTDSNRYKLGALLLDLNDPTKVLHKSSLPLLQPDADYENDYKTGVVFACGAVVKNDTLYIYYGGGDKHTCVAHAPLQELLDLIKR